MRKHNLTIADLKQHAADYAAEHNPHLKGEFQAFVQWIENEKPTEAPKFISPEEVEQTHVDPVKAGKEAARAAKDK